MHCNVQLFILDIFKYMINDRNLNFTNLLSNRISPNHHLKIYIVWNCWIEEHLSSTEIPTHPNCESWINFYFIICRAIVSKYEFGWGSTDASGNCRKRFHLSSTLKSRALFHPALFYWHRRNYKIWLLPPTGALYAPKGSTVSNWI